MIPIAAATPAADHADKIAALGIVVASLRSYSDRGMVSPRSQPMTNVTKESCASRIQANTKQHVTAYLVSAILINT